MWDEIAYLFPNLNGVPVEVWEWISNFIPNFPGHAITNPTISNISPVEHSRKYTRVAEETPDGYFEYYARVVKARQPFANLVF